MNLVLVLSDTNKTCNCADGWVLFLAFCWILALLLMWYYYCLLLNWSSSTIHMTVVLDNAFFFTFHFAFCYMTLQVIFQSIWSAGMYTCPHLYNAEKWNCLGHGSEVKTEKLLLSPMNVGGVKRDYPKAVDRYVRCCYDLAFLFSLWSSVLTDAICYKLG